MSNGNGHVHPGARLDLHQLAAKNGYPAPGSYEGHTCQGCGAPVECDFLTIAQVKAQARGDLIAAGHAERKLLGLPSGAPPRKINLTPEELRAMVARLGNINRARKALGVGHATFARHMNGDKAKR